jgi:hypothetical protein
MTNWGHCGVYKRSKVEGGRLKAKEKKLPELFRFCLDPRTSVLEPQIPYCLHVGIFFQFAVDSLSNSGIGSASWAIRERLK